MNKYDVLGVVGEGAYGVVLKCKNKDTSEVVAIKKFKESEEDEAVRKTTLREVKILRIVRHENIVQLKEAFRRKGKLYLVFEFIEKSMLDVLESNPTGVDTETVRLLTCQLGRAIEHCHRHDVIHRDIKPENLLINPVDSALRLCDFGFARTMTPDAPLTDYVATRWYRAPELLLGSTHYGKDVDIWALGCIMGELTDGQPLFAGESEVDQLFVIQKVLGPLTPEHMEMFLRNQRFLGIQFPDLSRPETLEKRYARRMPKLQMQLLKGVLTMESRKRLSAREMLRMPWFDGIKLPRSLRPPSQSRTPSTVPSRGSTAVGAQPPLPENTQPMPIQEPLRQHFDNQDSRGPREDPRISRDDPRALREEFRPPREDSRLAREDPRAVRDDPRTSDAPPQTPFDEPRPLRQDPRASMDQPRLLREDRRVPLEDSRMARDDSRMAQDTRSFHQQVPGLQPNLHFSQQPAAMRPHPYVLPWEDCMPEDGPPPDIGSNGSMPAAYGGDVDDKGPVDGRRSRQHRRQGATDTTASGAGDWCERLPGDRGTPSNGDRNGTPFGFSAGGPGSGAAAKPPRAGPGSSTAGCGGPGGGGASGGGPCGGTGTRLHGASAGTGGSEEWPSTGAAQARGTAARGLREGDLEEEKAVALAQWTQSGSRRKAGRHGTGSMPGPPSRRTPEPGDPPLQDSRHDGAWWGADAASEQHFGLGGLPSLRGGPLASGPPAGGAGGSGADVSSRVPSRPNIGSPTPREEDGLEFTGRQLHGVTGGGGGGRWGGSAAEWLGGGQELGPVRGPHYESRAPQQEGRVSLGGQGRGGPHHGH